jgi:hypothetical protein
MMKKVLLAAVLIGILFTISCRKDGSGAGSWNFEGVNYSAASAILTSGQDSLIATSGSNTNQGSTLMFYFGALPTRSGTYQVVNYTAALDSNQLYIRFINNTSSFYYFSTGNDHVNANVKVASNGKISVTVSSVYLESYSSAIVDSGQLTAVINQQ